MTTSIVLYLICKIVSGTRQTRGKGRDTTEIIVAH